MKRTLGLFVVAAWLFGCLPAGGAGDADRAADEAAVRQSVREYVEAYNRGDAEAIRPLWAENGRWITPDGEQLEGRKAIFEAMRSYFAKSAAQKPRLEVIDPTIRFPGPTVAVEEGRARVFSAEAEPVESSYLAIHVKRDGRWQLESIRETTVPAPSAPGGGPMEQLDWLVGTWVDQDEDTTIETTCEWTMNQQFLTRSFQVTVAGRPALSGTQIIGWDAATKQFRSWMFDSEGSFAEGLWRRDGNRWASKVKQTLRDGRLASSITVLTRVDDDTMTWQCTHREIDGQLQPNLGPVTVRRR
ncbi:MAG TPA: SgcJ/EcaC family oxidoreductase [Thermoguttaceae bacterium]|nr:SgcJ/EcaC family oxidoreductase [Thermoguttaceae bacterium]